ncbi:hypothetical protein SAMN05443247_10551 [Bradyrhizobium erythrophlei]|jgi:hypothetical protein|nr:hypothetical protein SAMN05443247_10551 [Bradyrhizobium erythrophlei]
MSHRVAIVPVLFQWVTESGGNTVRHDCDMGLGLGSLSPATFYPLKLVFKVVDKVSQLGDRSRDMVEFRIGVASALSAVRLCYDSVFAAHDPVSLVGGS